jgi:hypothetical protein
MFSHLPPDATYEISTDEYLSVVRCAIQGRTGYTRYRSEALLRLVSGRHQGMSNRRAKNDQEN